MDYIDDIGDVNDVNDIASQRAMIDEIVRELKEYARALDDYDREILMDILDKPLRHVDSISSASPLRPEIFILLSIILEQQKRMDEYEKLVNRYMPGTRKDAASMEG